MITIFGCTILFALVCFLLERQATKDFCWFSAGVGALGGLMIGTLISISVDLHIPMIKDKTLPTSIVAMRTKDGLSGSFVYGCGSLQGASKYTFLVKNSDGGIHPDFVWANDNVTIIEDPKLKDRGEFITLYQYPDRSHPLFYFSHCSTKTTEERLETTGYIFRVPVGSVVHQFSVE